MGNYAFENPRRGRLARDFTTNVPKILDLKSSSEHIFSENCRWVPLIKPIAFVALPSPSSDLKVPIFPEGGGTSVHRLCLKYKILVHPGSPFNSTKRKNNNKQICSPSLRSWQLAVLSR